MPLVGVNVLDRYPQGWNGQILVVRPRRDHLVPHLGEPQRFGQAAQVGEELRSPRQVDESLVVFVRQAGGDEVLELFRCT